MKENINIWWIRRDLRLEDNHALYEASMGGSTILPLFIVDTNITDQLSKQDARFQFIHQRLQQIHEALRPLGSGIVVKKGKPTVVWLSLLEQYNIGTVYVNEDYEPDMVFRDKEVEKILVSKGVSFKRFKDHVIFSGNEILKENQQPYTVYTPYKNKWLKTFHDQLAHPFNYTLRSSHLQQGGFIFPSLQELGFEPSPIVVHAPQVKDLPSYDQYRDFPYLDKTSYLSVHLRFGSVSVRQAVRIALGTNLIFLQELIWREFFTQILFHFPHVVSRCFHKKYDQLLWQNHEESFELWKRGETGYPIVDAGMRQLNQTGYMHNRVRMIVASFLCKHLLIDWRWGECYFAEKLLDYELSSNNGNWQWVAGTGCDAAPYYRIFNPTEQMKKFDPQMDYTRKWVKDVSEKTYPNPMVEHTFARNRALAFYKSIIAPSVL